MNKQDQQLQLVNSKQAKLLNELGFDWEVNLYYYVQIDDTVKLSQSSEMWNWNDTDRHFSAPTVALALKWLRDVKGVDNAASFTIKHDGVHFNPKIKTVYFGKYKNENNKSIYKETENFDTHDIAASALLDEIIELLTKLNRKE